MFIGQPATVTGIASFLDCDDARMTQQLTRSSGGRDPLGVGSPGGTLLGLHNYNKTQQN